MSYRVRWVSPDGKTGHWTAPIATREEAEEHAALRQMANGLSYTVEEVSDAPDPKPEPTSTTERLVRLLHDRHARGLAKYGTTLDRTDLAPGEWAQHAIDEALDLAGYLMRLKDGFAPEPGSTAEHHVEILRDRVKELEAELAMAKAGLAKAPSVPVGASEAPREGGDSDRRRLEALDRWFKGHTRRRIRQVSGYGMAAESHDHGIELVAPTLAALADKLAEKEDKP